MKRLVVKFSKITEDGVVIDAKQLYTLFGLDKPTDKKILIRIAHQQCI